MNFFNGAQIHLAINHIPLILTLAGFVMIGIALAGSKEHLTKTSLYIFVAAGLFCIPTYFSGEGAEEVVENLPGITHRLIHRHEESAQWALTACMITAVLSLLTLLLYTRAGKRLRILVFLSALASLGILGRASHLGGLIHHPELRQETGPGTYRDNEPERVDSHEDHD